MKSYGRAPTFLLATGYEQVRSVTAALAGDDWAAITCCDYAASLKFCGKSPGSQGELCGAAVARICVGLRARKKARTWCTRTILRVVTVNVARSSAGFPQRVHMFSGRVLVRWMTCQLGGSWFAGGWGWPRAM
jgi:hypothetical protein